MERYRGRSLGAFDFFELGLVAVCSALWVWMLIRALPIIIFGD